MGRRLSKGLKPEKKNRDWLKAAEVSLVLTVADLFLAFLTIYEFENIVLNPSLFLFNLIRFSGATFFNDFIALTGLVKHLRSKIVEAEG